MRLQKLLTFGVHIVERMHIAEWGKKMELKTGFDGELKLESCQLSVGRLLYASERFLSPEDEPTEETLACDEICCVVSGIADLCINGGRTELKPGGIAYIKSGTHRRLESANGSKLRYLHVCIRANNDNRYIKELYSAAEVKNSLTSADSGYVRILLELLVNELYTPDLYASLALEGYAKLIYINLISLFKLPEYGEYYNYDKNGKNDEADKDGGYKNAENIKANKLVHRVLRYIDCEYMNIMSVDDIAAHFSYSLYYLSHVFKRYTGFSLKQYLIERKLERAAELMEQTDLSVSDITNRVGYVSVAAFCRAFKKRFGMVTGEYRKKSKF